MARSEKNWSKEKLLAGGGDGLLNLNHFTALGKFHRITDEIHQHLPQTLFITPKKFTHAGGILQAQRQAFLFSIYCLSFPNPFSLARKIASERSTTCSLLSMLDT